LGAYKLDLTQAYDRVEWSFLEGALGWLSFHSIWVRWIIECVTIVRYSIRFNNTQLEPFHPSRGLHKMILYHRTFPFLSLMVCHR
jgi:hypothetical protein